MTKLEEARAFFAGDRFATENGAVIDEIGEHYAICSMEITPHHLNAAGRVMGGAVFMLADFAFAVASNFGHPADQPDHVSPPLPGEDAVRQKSGASPGKNCGVL